LPEKKTKAIKPLHNRHPKHADSSLCYNHGKTYFIKISKFCGNLQKTNPRLSTFYCLKPLISILCMNMDLIILKRIWYTNMSTENGRSGTHRHEWPWCRQHPGFEGSGSQVRPCILAILALAIAPPCGHEVVDNSIDEALASSLLPSTR